MNPLRLVPRVRRAYAALDELERRESWTREQIQRFQLGRINRLWATARTDVPHYRRLAAEHGLPRRFDSVEHYLAEMPLVHKDVLREDGHALLSDRGGRGAWYPTSGSTGSPLEFFWSHDAHQEVLRARYRFYASWGVDILDPAVFVWGGGEHGGWRGRFERSVQSVQDVARRRLRLSAASPDGRDVERIVRHDPAVVYGYTQAVHLLAERVQERGATFPSLRAVIVTGETARPGVLDAISEAFGVPAVVEYGATECMLIAGSNPDGALQVREDLVLAETIERPDGRHDIVITVLLNPSFPMLRYVIEDVSPDPLTVPEIGFATLSSVTGRTDDLVMASSGAAVHPSTFDAVFEERTSDVRRYRIHQLLDGSVDVLVQPDDAGRFDEGVVRGELQQLVGDYEVRLTVVGEIAAANSGKRHVVRSELATRDR